MKVREPGIPREDPTDSMADSLDALRNSLRSAGDLASGITQDLSKLIRLEIELAKQEILEIAKTKAVAAGLVIVAGVLGIVLVPFMLLTLFEILAVWMPRWASALLVTLLIAAGCAGIFLVAKSKFEDNFKPERTIRSLEDNLAWLKRLGRRHGREP